MSRLKFFLLPALYLLALVALNLFATISVSSRVVTGGDVTAEAPIAYTLTYHGLPAPFLTTRSEVADLFTGRQISPPIETTDFQIAPLALDLLLYLAVFAFLWLIVRLLRTKKAPPPGR